MEKQPIPSEEELIQKRKYASQVEPPQRDWPTMPQVEAQYPNLCGEEQTWILEALIHEAHERKYNADSN